VLQAHTSSRSSRDSGRQLIGMGGRQFVGMPGRLFPGMVGAFRAESANKATLIAEIAAWERRRNREKAKIKWMFTTEKAREKLRKAYPVKVS